MELDNTERKIVMGLGNTLNKDEGLGVHALELLQKKIADLAPEVEFLDGGALDKPASLGGRCLPSARA